MRTLFLNVVNRSLHPLGVHLVRYSRFLNLISEMQSTDRDFSFLQVGANDGRSFDEQFFSFVVRTNSKGIVVEPLKDLYEKLVENYRCCPNVRPINLALHPTASKAVLYRVAPEKLKGLADWAVGISSFLPDHYQKTNIPADAIAPVEVECIHLMELVDMCSLRKLHLLQIDVEGFDAEVIRMIDFDKLRPLVIKFEHINLKDEDARSVVSLLRREKYQCFREGPDTVAVSAAIKQ